MGRNRKQPFGYGMEKGKVVIQLGESTWVKHLYQEYNVGVPMRALAEYMQGTGVSYEEGKKWNINMIARILSDERYIGADGYPEIIAKDMLQATAEKRAKKAPAVHRTEAQKMLRRKCRCRVTPHIEHEVLYLLNTVAGNPERIEAPKGQKRPNTELRLLQSELSDMMETLPVDEKRAREKLLEVAIAIYEAIDPNEYETHRMKRVFGNEQRRSELDSYLIYLEQGDPFLPGDHLKEFVVRGEKIDISRGVPNDIYSNIRSGVNTRVPGVYTVEYTLTKSINQESFSGRAILVVIVQD